MFKNSTILFIIVLFQSLLSNSSYSQTGTLDPTFGNSGIDTLSPGSLHDVAYDVICLEDTSMYVCGAAVINGFWSGILMHLNPDGSQDMSFGTNGLAVMHYVNDAFAYDMELLPDGNIVVAGLSYMTTSNSEFFVARFLPNGTPDVTFNSTGYATSDYSGVEETCYAIAVQEDGKYVLAGYTTSGGFSNLLFWRVNSDGTTDDTFGEDGYTFINASPQDESILDLGFLSDGTIVGAGRGYQTNPIWADKLFLTKLTPSGLPVPGFGVEGTIIPPVITDVSSASGIVIFNDTIMLTGIEYNESNNYQIIVTKLDTLGNAYSYFGDNGKATLNINANNEANDIYRSDDGKLYVCGTTGPSAFSSDFVIARFTPEGALDPTFNSIGYTVTPVMPDWDVAMALDIQVDGKVVLAGMASGISTTGNNDIALARYQNDYIPNGVYALFTANPRTTCEGEQITFTDGSFSSDNTIISWNWTFEGGTPATSSQQNPVVTYNAAGVFDVQLIVTDGVYIDTLLKQNYISIEAIPLQPEIPVGSSDVCNGYETELTTDPVEYTDVYEWLVTPSDAGTIAGNSNTVIFYASPSWTGTCVVNVRATGLCGISDWSEAFSLSIWLNPDVFNLTGIGEYCSGDPGAELILDGSEIGVDYELFKNNNPTGIIFGGTGNPLSFGFITETGNYKAAGFTDHCFEYMDYEIYVNEIMLPAQADTPTGPEFVCTKDTSLFQTTEIQFADNYVWSLEPVEAGTIVPMQQEISIIWNSSFTGLAELSVHGENVCGSGPVSDPLSITVNISPNPIISGMQEVCKNDEETYQTLNNPESSYSWQVTGGEIISGVGTSTVIVKWTISGEGLVTVTELNDVGCQETSYFPVQIDDCTFIGESETNIKVYPNPTGDVLNISFAIVNLSNIDILISDITGKTLISSVQQTKNTIQLDVSGLDKGIYLISLYENNKILLSQKFIKK